MSTANQLPLDRLWHWERTRADAIYLTQPIGGGTVRDFTWAEAADQVRRMAAYLRSLGFVPGARIALIGKNSAWWYLADYAILAAGYVCVPLYPSQTRDAVRYILEHAEAKLCFIGKLEDPAEMEAGIPAGMPCIELPLARLAGRPHWDEIVARTAPLTDVTARPRDELATIVYTSGTTGVPKGVMHSFATMAEATRIVAEEWKVVPEDRVLSFLPSAHIADRWMSQYVLMWAGARTCFAESLETFADDLRRTRPTLFGCVPRLWAKFQQGVFAKIPKEKLERRLRIPLLGAFFKRLILRKLGLGAVRIAVGGAATMPPELMRWFRGLGLEMVELYGMTENFGLATTNQPGRVKIGTVGPPWPGVECRISEQGEILIRSPGNTLGYYKQPELTRELFTDDGYLRTGDMGEIDADGYLRIVGRVREQFKTSKGKFVVPAPIENQLAAHSSVEAVCVTGVDAPQPFALLMLPGVGAERWDEAHEREALTQSLGDHLDAVNSRLAKHEQLDFVVVLREQWTISNGLLTPTMKIKRAMLEKHYGAHYAAWSARKQKVVWA